MEKIQHLSLAASVDGKKTSNARCQWSFLFFFVFGQPGVGVELAERFQPGVEHVVDNRGDVVEFVGVGLRVKKVDGERGLERLRPGDARDVETVEVDFPRVENNAGVDFLLRLLDVDGVVLFLERLSNFFKELLSVGMGGESADRPRYFRRRRNADAVVVRFDCPVVWIFKFETVFVVKFVWHVIRQ